MPRKSRPESSSASAFTPQPGGIQPFLGHSEKFLPGRKQILLISNADPLLGSGQNLHLNLFFLQKLLNKNGQKKFLG